MIPRPKDVQRHRFDDPAWSGTNGYVQRNLSFVQQKKDRINYKTEEEIKWRDKVRKLEVFKIEGEDRAKSSTLR